MASSVELSHPLIIEDTHTDPRTAGLPAREVFRKVGSYIGVPIILGNGTFYGTLCAVDPEQRHLSARQAETLVILARLLATQIERDGELAERRRVEKLLRQTNTQLEEASNIKSEIVSLVSHEFRTPLTVIQGFSEMMRDEMFSEEEIREYAADIYEQATRLNRMITEMLDLDRIEAGKMVLHTEDLDLSLLITEVTTRAQQTTPLHRLIYENAGPPLPISADRDKLTQVLTNLVSNAIKYSPQGGEIRLKSARQEDQVLVSVRDHGLGIPPEALETIFERYSRVEAGNSHKIQGTGLGLPIVRQIVELHRGKVWAESSQGEGTTLYFTIPCASDGRAGERGDRA